jgi:hypothetical protein
LCAVEAGFFNAPNGQELESDDRVVVLTSKSQDVELVSMSGASAGTLLRPAEEGPRLRGATAVSSSLVSGDRGSGSLKELGDLAGSDWQ